SLGGRISSTPVAAVDRLYVGTDDSRFVAVERSTGKTAFTFKADNAVRGRAAVLGDDVFFATLGGTVYQVDRANGAERSRTALPDAVPVDTGAVAGDTKIFVVDTQGVLRAICPKGGILWSLPLGGKAASTPLWSEGHVYIATDAGSIFCIKE
ncbi:MAG: PQQ-binding-like beta-propeller repeat protein, partial [Planctomycetota bacterium]